MNIFEWVFNKKKLESELDNLDRDLDNIKIKNNKLKREVERYKEQINFLEDKDFQKIITIKDLRKEIKDLKRQIEGSDKK